MNQIDHILKQQAALEFNAKQLEQLRSDEHSGGAVASLINCAIEGVRDAIEALERAVVESEE